MVNVTMGWAAVSKESGAILRDHNGHYGIYTFRDSAEKDCPKYGSVQRVRITVANECDDAGETK